LKSERWKGYEHGKNRDNMAKGEVNMEKLKLMIIVQ